MGADAGGLCPAKYLIAQGIEVAIFEVGSHIGGLSIYDNDSRMSPAYESLPINSEEKVCGVIDFPFPNDAPLYPDHAEMSRHFDRYADHFELRRRIRFNLLALCPPLTCQRYFTGGARPHAYQPRQPCCSPVGRRSLFHRLFRRDRQQQHPQDERSSSIYRHNGKGCRQIPQRKRMSLLRSSPNAPEWQRSFQIPRITDMSLICESKSPARQ
jgi:hypothetical protein